MYQDRLLRLQSRLKQLKVDCLLILKQENIRYLTGFTPSNGMLLVGSNKMYLLVDFRYAEQAQKEVCEIRVVTFKTFPGEVLKELIAEIKGEKVGFESHVFTFDYFEKIKSSSGRITFKPLANLVENIRAVKEESEIEKIRKAAQIGDKAFEHILPFIKEGVRERDLAIELEFFMLKNGAEKESFDIIVAFGERSSMPHAVATERRLKFGDFIKLDFGATFQGYHSDMTRTLVFGRANQKQKEIYGIVKRAQEEALAAIKLEIETEKIDSAARDYISKANYGEFFGHGLGHGVGLEVHELPILKAGSRDILKAGMVFTVEPGIYLSDFGGVRIEDLVVLRDDGVEILTRSPKELLEL